MKETVYISFNKNTIVTDSRITIGSIADVWCSDKNVTAKVRALLIANAPDVKSRRYVFSAIDIIKIIQQQVEGVDVNALGEPDFVISYKKDEAEKRWWTNIKVFVICLIVFFGGAFAITAYGNDVDVEGIFEHFSNFVGGRDNSVLAMKICYCVGISLGVIIFYNHLASRKKEKDPTPMEIGMKLYEDDVNTTIINNSEKESR